MLQLVRLTHRVAQLATNSPIMKLLTGAELILKKAEEWDQAAPREMKVHESLKPLALLVRRWRKMELHTWPKALALKEEQFRAQSHRLWFQLYTLVHVSEDGELLSAFALP